MREYHSVVDIAVSGNEFQFAVPQTIARITSNRTASTATLTTGEVDGAVSVSVTKSSPPIDSLHLSRSLSRQSLNASQWSIAQSSFDCWPEFQRNYNSIMDNTNLLDSCAAALSDITFDEMDSCEMTTLTNSTATSTVATLTPNQRAFYRDLSLLERNLYDTRRDSSATTSSTSLGGKSSFGSSTSSTATTKCVTDEEIQLFTHWLNEMELRMSKQPTLSQIFTMNADEMAVQLKIHLRIFNEIVSQPCIVKGAKNKDHATIEERYHLLYLKAYEVLLLLETSDGDQINSRKILTRDEVKRIDVEKMKFDSSNGTSDDFEPIDDCDSGDAGIGSSDNNDKEDSKSIAVSRTASNMGTFYFTYEEKQPTHEQLNGDENSCSDIGHINSCDNSDKALTFDDHEIHSFLNDDRSTIASECHDTPLQPQPSEETMQLSQNSHLWNDFDFGCWPQTPTDFQIIDRERFWPKASGVSEKAEAHSKVRNWLDHNAENHRSAVTNSSDLECRALYRTRSEHDLNAMINTTASFRSSLQCLASQSNVGETRTFEKETSSGSGCSLEWDFYQVCYDQENEREDGRQTSNGNNEFDHKALELANEWCNFGNDYSMYLNNSSSSTLLDVSQKSECDNVTESIVEIEQTSIDESTTTTVTVNEVSDNELREKRIRRNRNKRAKRRRERKLLRERPCDSSEETVPTSDTSSVTSTTSETNVSLASTASLDTSKFDNFVNENRAEDAINATIDNTVDDAPESTNPPKTIKYNNRQFEIYGSDKTSTPKTRRVSELKPEDFYDIIAMCHKNIDCVMTVLGAEPNRLLTVAYCQQMKLERKRQANREMCNCNLEKSNNKHLTKCKCNDGLELCVSNDTCLCAWVAQTVAMIINFLIDCWNIFRNMRLYTYLCRFMKNLFGSTRYVADHLKAKRQLVNW